MMLAPSAQLANGQLEIVLMRDGPMLKTLALSTKVYGGTHVDSSMVEVHRGTELRVENKSPYPVYIDVDGESPGNAPATFRVVPKAIRLLDVAVDKL